MIFRVGQGPPIAYLFRGRIYGRQINRELQYGHRPRTTFTNRPRRPDSAHWICLSTNLGKDETKAPPRTVSDRGGRRPRGPPSFPLSPASPARECERPTRSGRRGVGMARPSRPAIEGNRRQACLKRRNPKTGAPMTGAIYPPLAAGPADEDAALVRRCRQGDVEAFGVRVTRYEARVGALVARILGINAMPEDVEDTTQDVFIQAWRALPRFRGDAQFSTWLYRVATNTAIRQWHRRKKQRRVRHRGGRPGGRFANSAGRGHRAPGGGPRPAHGDRRAAGEAAHRPAAALLRGVLVRGDRADAGLLGRHHLVPPAVRLPQAARSAALAGREDS